MRAAVTVAPNVIEIDTIDPPSGPELDGLIIRPELVGVCGSDIHFYTGHLETAPKDGPQFPRIQGHEFAGIVEAVGDAVKDDFEVGQRVAVWPLSSCGRCYPCRVGRPSVCDNFSIIGIHTDGALTERLRVPARQAFPTGDLSAALSSFVEPVAVGAHAVARAAVGSGERVVVFGGGPIGQAVSLAAQHRGGRVLIVEPLASRREISLQLGAEAVLDAAADTLAGTLSDWTDGDGAAVVFDTSGSPAAIRAAVEAVASAGRVVVLSISDGMVSLPIAAFTEKEFDLIGSSCHDSRDFTDAIEIVASKRPSLESLLGVQFSLDDTAKALEFSSERADAALKVMVRVSE